MFLWLIDMSLEPVSFLYHAIDGHLHFWFTAGQLIVTTGYCLFAAILIMRPARSFFHKHYTCCNCRKSLQCLMT